MAVELNKHIQPLLAEIQLMEGEEIEYYIQADGFFAGANPLVKLMATIQAFLVTITGGHQRIFLVITNYRVLLLRSIQQWCGANRVRGYHTIASSSVLEASTSKQTIWCCIHTRMVQLESKTQEHTLIVKKMKDEHLQEFLTQLSVLIISNTSSS